MKDVENWNLIQVPEQLKMLTKQHEMLTNNGGKTLDVSSWVTWTYAFAFIDNVAQLVYIKTSNASLKKALFATHTALMAIDEAFIDAINQIKKGEIPRVDIKPIDIVGWSDDPTALDSIIGMIKPVLAKILQQIQKSAKAEQYEKVIFAVAALINALEDLEKALKGDN